MLGGMLTGNWCRLPVVCGCYVSRVIAVDICSEGCSLGMVPPTCSMWLLCYRVMAVDICSEGCSPGMVPPTCCSLRVLCFASYGG